MDLGCSPTSPLQTQLCLVARAFPFLLWARVCFLCCCLFFWKTLHQPLAEIVNRQSLFIQLLGQDPLNQWMLNACAGPQKPCLLFLFSSLQPRLPLSILLVFLPPIPSGSMVAINEPQLPALALTAMNKALCWEPSTSDELNRGAIVGLYYSPNMACAFAVAEVHHCPSSECIDPHYKSSTERSWGWCTHEIQSKSSSSSIKP